MPISAYLYDAESLDGAVNLTPEIRDGLSDKQLLWVDVNAFEKDELRQVERLFELNPDSTRLFGEADRRPRLDIYSNYFQVHVRTIQEVERFYRVVGLDFIVGTNYVITVHQNDVEFLESFSQQVRDDSQLGRLDSAGFLAALLDWHLNAYFQVVERIEVNVDRIDERALRARSKEDPLVEMVQVRRRISQVRRVLTPHREVLASLARPDFQVLSQSGSATHFRDLNDRLEHAIDAVENARDLLVGSFEIYMSHTGQRTNQVIKLLTLASVIFFIAGVTASVMSMNFKIPLYDTGERGFWSVIAFIVLSSAGCIAFARWKKWV